ncbi:MAG: NADH-quinone oxidoreductase subunit M, partial [Legionella sp. 21-45-4]
MQQHLLTLLIGLPILGGGLVLAVGNDREPIVAKMLTLLIIGLSLILCYPLMHGFNLATPGMQFVELAAWMPSLGLHYQVGVDGLALLLIVLSVFTNLIVVLATWDSIKHRVTQYLAALLVMQ